MRGLVQFEAPRIIADSGYTRLPPQPAQCDLTDIVIGHLDQLTRTGCVRAGHRARLLLDHMDEDPERIETSAMLRRLLQRLQWGLSN